jgi:hypothetical protein
VLGLLVLLLLLLLVALLFGWVDVDLSGGDVVAPDVDVDVDVPDVTVEGGELPDVDIESTG